jgi:hypothetical protein
MLPNMASCRERKGDVGLKDCKACNHTNSGSSRYCDQCGAKLDEASTTPKVITPETFASAPKPVVPGATDRFGEPIAPQSASAGTWDGEIDSDKILKVVGGVAFGFIAILGFLSVFNSPSSSKRSVSVQNVPTESIASAKPVRVDHYKEGLRFGAEGSFEVAIGELYLVGPKHKDYKKAQAKIREYKQKLVVAQKAAEHQAKQAEIQQKKEEEGRLRLTNPEQFVTVQNGWTWQIDGDWDYIRGSVKNDTSRVVTYWAATVRFYNSAGNEIDSDFTNGGQPIYPGASKRFEIMHRNIPGTTASMEITSVRFAN